MLVFHFKLLISPHQILTISIVGSKQTEQTIAKLKVIWIVLCTFFIYNLKLCFLVVSVIFFRFWSMCRIKSNYTIYQTVKQEALITLSYKLKTKFKNLHLLHITKMNTNIYNFFLKINSCNEKHEAESEAGSSYSHLYQ